MVLPEVQAVRCYTNSAALDHVCLVSRHVRAKMVGGFIAGAAWSYANGWGIDCQDFWEEGSGSHLMETNQAVPTLSFFSFHQPFQMGGGRSVRKFFSLIRPPMEIDDKD